jgi:SAM-dependent methyltransferase
MFLAIFVLLLAVPACNSQPPQKKPMAFESGLTEQDIRKVEIPRSLQTSTDSLPDRVAAVRDRIRLLARDGGTFSEAVPNIRTTIDRLEFAPGAVMADIGAGSGMLELALLETGRPFGKIFAVDIDAAALELLDFALETTAYPGREKVKTVVSASNDITLPPDSIDVAILVSNPAFLGPFPNGAKGPAPQIAECLSTVVRAIKPGGVFEAVFDRLPSDDATDRTGIIVALMGRLGLTVVNAYADPADKPNPIYHYTFAKPALGN